MTKKTVTLECPYCGAKCKLKLEGKIPQHTDEEYELLETKFIIADGLAKRFQVRIKELEAENERLKNGIADLDEYISKQIWRERD